MAKKPFPVGTKIGRLKILGEGPMIPTNSGKFMASSLCLCECGKTKSIRNTNLRTGVTRSCGCLQPESARKRATHGHAKPGLKSKTYRTWSDMKARCHNQKTRGYANYGGRGIAVCERWLNSFEHFLEDMGEAPPGKTLERINNSFGYFPENCRWASMEDQAHNRRTNRIITVDGVTGCVTDLANRFGWEPRTIFLRLQKGWTPQRAFSEPLRNGGKKKLRK